METSEEIRQAFYRYLRNEYTEADFRLIQDSFQQEQNRDHLCALMEAQLNQETADEAVGHRVDAVISRVDESIRAELAKQRKQTVPLYRKWYIGAAAVLLVSLSILYFYQAQQRSLSTAPQQIVNDVRPGGNKATLRLASGKVIQLDEQANGAIGSEAGIVITKTTDGQLAYEVTSGAGDGEGFNTITTPKGGQYQVHLPDGSKVWLNAVSTLTFSTSLRVRGENNRKVFLSGEAYFDIAKDKLHPFIVKAGGQEVKVLGTHFNVTSYADEKLITTTLEEGSVQVSANNGNKIIKPGEQTLFDGKEMEVKLADLQTVLAWKNGKLKFNSADIDQIMRQVARWYDIDIAYKGKIPKDTFTGAINRQSNLSTVLKFFEASQIHFQLKNINGRNTLVIQP